MDIDQIAYEILTDVTSIPDGYELIQNQNITYINHHLENRVNIVHHFNPEKFKDIISTLKKNHPNKLFRWAISPFIQSSKIDNLFKKYGFKYSGDLHNYCINPNELYNLPDISNEYQIIQISTLKEMKDYCKVREKMSSRGISISTDEIKREFDLLTDQNIKFNIYKKDEMKIVSTSAAKVYPKYNLLYLCGAFTLPKFQRKGIYTSSISARIKFAQKNNLSKVLSIAKADSSGPALKKIGLKQYGTLKFWTMIPTKES